jgi:hypothetical protein
MWIGGGLMMAAVAVIVFLRARAGGQSVAPETVPDDQGGFGGGGMSIGAPSGQIADEYQSRLDQSEVEANSIANAYQRQLMQQQERSFDFEQSQNEALAPNILAYERERLAAGTEYERVKKAIPFACPPGYARAKGPDGELTCNPKGSGSILTEPYKAVHELERGITRAAPEIGYQVAKDAAAYYTGQAFRSQGSTVPINPNYNAPPAKRKRIYEPQGSPLDSKYTRPFEENF